LTISAAIAPAAQRLGVDVPALTAVVLVESGGIPVIPNQPLIRLEVHLLWSAVPVGLRAAVDARFAVAGMPLPSTPTRTPTRPLGTMQTQAWEGHQCLLDGLWWPMHQPGSSGQTLERRCFDVAAAIDPAAAICSTSWGLAQILGKHWTDLGFADVGAFVAAQQTEAGQVDTFARFVAESQAMLDALRTHDWQTFARLYNGPGKATDYARKLAMAYKQAGGI